MITTTQLSPGVTLRCIRDTRFKHSVLSLQWLRPMAAGEAAMNALLPDILLRGSQKHPDLRAVTHALDDLYGASISPLVRRVGDWQTVGFFCRFTDDRFTLAGDAILEPLTALLAELVGEPLTENGAFRCATVEREKGARIQDIESLYNDKPAWSANRLLERMCRDDSFGIPRQGTAEQVEAITAQGLYDQYQLLLHRAPVEFFYVGPADAARVAALLQPLFGPRQPEPLPRHSHFQGGPPCRWQEPGDTAQSCLNLAFVTDIDQYHPDDAAMRMLNTILGGGMISKLFMNVREKLSLCYSIGSSYYAAKGIVTVAAGIEARQRERAEAEIMAQLEACRRGEISDTELEAAREALLSATRSVYDSPGSMEGFFALRALCGLPLSPEPLAQAFRAVTREDVVRCAQSLELHSSFFLKGGGSHG